MKKMILAGAGIGLLALAACHSSPREQVADNIEANADSFADNLESAAGNTNSAALQNSLQNRADATRALGDNLAADMRTHDPDTNLANGI